MKSPLIETILKIVRVARKRTEDEKKKGLKKPK